MTTTKETASRGSGSSPRASDSQRPLDRLSALGAAIVQSFEHESDRLSQWMAHHLAALIDTADRDRSRARREAASEQAADLILRLWRHRDHWARGWPPGDVGALLGRLRQLESMSRWDRQFQQPEPSQSGWQSALTELDRLAQLEHDVVFAAALTSTDSKDLERWLEASRLASEEDDLLEQLERNTEAARRKLTKRVDPRRERSGSAAAETNEDLQQNALAILRDINKRRAVLIKAITTSEGTEPAAKRRKSSVPATKRR